MVKKKFLFEIPFYISQFLKHIQDYHNRMYHFSID